MLTYIKLFTSCKQFVICFKLQELQYCVLNPIETCQNISPESAVQERLHRAAYIGQGPSKVKILKIKSIAITIDFISTGSQRLSSTKPCKIQNLTKGLVDSTYLVVTNGMKTFSTQQQPFVMCTQHNILMFYFTISLYSKLAIQFNTNLRINIFTSL